MTYTQTSSSDSLAQDFRNLEVDQQLALFWYIYTEMGQSITPAAPGAGTASPVIAEGLYNQVKEKSQDEQLQIMRDLVGQKNSLICREYGALGDTTKLLFWYLLAQGMDKSVIINVPQDYQLSGEAENILSQIKTLQFSEQITLFRDIVAPMGVDPNNALHDVETGL